MMMPRGIVLGSAGRLYIDVLRRFDVLRIISVYIDHKSMAGSRVSIANN